MRWLDGINSMDMSLSKLQEISETGKPGVLQSVGLQSDTTEGLNNNPQEKGRQFQRAWVICHLLLPPSDQTPLRCVSWGTQPGP